MQINEQLECKEQEHYCIAGTVINTFSLNKSLNMPQHLFLFVLHSHQGSLFCTADIKEFIKTILLIV